MQFQRPATSQVLTSEWGGLNDALIAKFYPVKRLESGSWQQSRDVREVVSDIKYTVADGFEVWAPISNGTLELVSNWQSPFENTGPNSVLSSFSAMLQSGSFTSAGTTIANNIGVNLQGTAMGKLLAQATGSASITKLNSQQIFSGSPPMKMQFTAHFRAFQDPKKEVQQPISMLKQWMVPEHLASDSIVIGAAKNGIADGFINTVFPSRAPTILGMKYADMTIMPVVIESISESMNHPRHDDGVMTYCALQMTVATLTALDRHDIQKLYL